MENISNKRNLLNKRYHSSFFLNRLSSMMTESRREKMQLTRKGIICHFLIFLLGMSFASAGGAFRGEKKIECLKLEYLISVDDKNSNDFSIKAKISGIQTESLPLRMTANYGRVKKLNELIPRITISSEGKEISNIQKINDFLWKIPLNSSEIEVDYSVNTQFPYSSLNRVRLPYHDSVHLYFPASSVFIYPEEQYLSKNNIKIQNIKVLFELPSGWIVATSWGTNKLAYELNPPSLETLIDGLIGVGSYSVYSFLVEGLPVETAILNPEKTVQNIEVKRAIEQGLKSAYNLFHFFPLSRFFAMVHFINEQSDRLNGNALGWSVNLNCSRTLNYAQWLEMVSHLFAEIFHHWNGTEGPPLSRAQNDYSLIWFTEGITNFYRLKNMLTAGLISEEEYFHFLSKEFNDTFYSSRCEDNLDEISQDYYSDPKAMTLTYSKGCCLAFALDLRIRTISGGEKSFDSVLKLLLERNNYRKTGRFYNRDDLEKVFMEVLGKEHFPEYRNLYGKGFVEQFKRILNEAALSLEKKEGRRLYFGILNFGPPGGPVRVLSLDRGSPAYIAGLRAGDILLEINGQKIKTAAAIKELVRNIPENELVKLILERNGKRVHITTLWNSYATEFVITKKKY